MIAERAARKTAEVLRQAKMDPGESNGSLEEIIRNVLDATEHDNCFVLAAGGDARGRRAVGGPSDHSLREVTEIIYKQIQERADGSLSVGDLAVGLFKDPRELVRCAAQIADEVKGLDTRKDSVSLKASLGLTAISSAQSQYPGLGRATLMKSVLQARRAGPMSLRIPRHFNIDANEVTEISRRTTFGKLEKTRGQRYQIAFRSE